MIANGLAYVRQLQSEIKTLKTAKEEADGEIDALKAKMCIFAAEVDSDRVELDALRKRVEAADELIASWSARDGTFDQKKLLAYESAKAEEKNEFAEPLAFSIA